MQLQELKRNWYLFDPAEYGRIFTYVDFGNVRHWAKAFWPAENKQYIKKEVDISKVFSVSSMVNPLKQFFYYGHYKEHPELPFEHPLNVKYRQSIFRIDKARKCGFDVTTKDIKIIDNYDENGKYIGKLNKCNFDVEMTMDILLKIDKYDTIFLWSGDSDFSFLLKHIKSKSKKIVTICPRKYLSDELQKISDKIIPADPLKDLLEYVKKTT